jgi:hypothetical protein
MKMFVLVLVLIVTHCVAGEKLSPPKGFGAIGTNGSNTNTARMVGEVIPFLIQAGIQQSNSTAIAKEIVALSDERRAEEQTLRNVYRSEIEKVLIANSAAISADIRSDTAKKLAELGSSDSTPVVMLLLSQGVTTGSEKLIEAITSVPQPKVANPSERSLAYVPILRNAGANNPELSSARIAAILDRYPYR